MLQVVYTSNVNVFRSSQATGYQYLPEVYRLSFVAAAAENGPRLVPTKGGYRLNSSAASALFDKIATLLSAAQQNEHDAVVLSALGMWCGAGVPFGLRWLRGSGDAVPEARPRHYDETCAQASVDGMWHWPRWGVEGGPAGLSPIGKNP